MKKNVIKAILIIIFSAIAIILISTLNNNTNYISFDYKIESIRKADNNLYITFFEDESKEQIDSGKNIVYTIYGHQVDLNLLNHIQEGETVNITVEDNYGKFKYTIIYELKYNNEVIFNIMKNYSTLQYNNKIVFASFFCSIILFLVFLSIYKEKRKTNTINDFIIHRPLWEKYLFIGSIFGALGFIIPFTILYILKLCDIEYFKFSFVFYIFVVLGTFGLYVTIKEKFVYANETFTYYRVFGKPRSAKLSEIRKVTIKLGENRRSPGKVLFLDDNNKKVIWFTLDFNLFVDDLFENVCKKNKIKIQIK